MAYYQNDDLEFLVDDFYGINEFEEDTSFDNPSREKNGDETFDSDFDDDFDMVGSALLLLLVFRLCRSFFAYRKSLCILFENDL